MSFIQLLWPLSRRLFLFGDPKSPMTDDRESDRGYLLDLFFYLTNLLKGYVVGFDRKFCYLPRFD